MAPLEAMKGCSVSLSERTHGEEFIQQRLEVLTLGLVSRDTLRRENLMKRTSTVVPVLLAGLMAIICLWPDSAAMAQQVVATLDKDDPELRAILAKIEADAEKARVKAQVPGMSIVIVHDQDVLLAKGYG